MNKPNHSENRGLSPIITIITTDSGNQSVAIDFNLNVGNVADNNVIIFQGNGNNSLRTFKNVSRHSAMKLAA